MYEVYRIYDEGGILLYVGRSLGAMARLVQHRDSKAIWFNEMAFMMVERYDTLGMADAAEAAAIRDELPKYNCHGVRMNDTRTEWADRILAGEVTAKDWPEDLDHHAGLDQHMCCRCHQEFIGHKRRWICRECKTKS